MNRPEISGWMSLEGRSIFRESAHPGELTTLPQVQEPFVNEVAREGGVRFTQLGEKVLEFLGIGQIIERAADRLIGIDEALIGRIQGWDTPIEFLGHGREPIQDLSRNRAVRAAPSRSENSVAALIAISSRYVRARSLLVIGSVIFVGTSSRSDSPDSEL